jgi:hypothetical protein
MCEEVVVPNPERQTVRIALPIKPSMKRTVERRARTEGTTIRGAVALVLSLALSLFALPGSVPTAQSLRALLQGRHREALPRNRAG